MCSSDLVPHPSDQVLRVEAIIDRAPTVDGEPNSEKTKGTCQAPRGRVQIYVDGEPVGAPEPLVFAGDLSEDGKPIPAGDPRINATVEDTEPGVPAPTSPLPAPPPLPTSSCPPRARKGAMRSPSSSSRPLTSKRRTAFPRTTSRAPIPPKIPRCPGPRWPSIQIGRAHV